MAKLYFYYSAMNAGKTTHLLQSSYNYRERGMNTLILSPAIDNRFGVGKVTSRIGVSSPSIIFAEKENIYNLVKKYLKEQEIHCVLVDEAQFLSKDQVYQLTEIVDQENIPVLAYGLRTDFQGELFQGSHYLLAWADSLKELKTICHSGKKATMVVRVDENGRAVKDGNQVEIGGNDKYVSVSRAEYKRIFFDKGTIEPIQLSLPIEDKN
ncbi:MAG TPA: thymidine kinase [Gammaproteobacteria bacterium]|jgi:thymidine kinase|nr:thymidine kinase [Xanthomonadales bacterium]HOP22056.1 thymidine kinase [Gammaproteobacteria bacterium]MCB1594705.1 thymidine kinase [Xanthomonadales bacterium]MCB1603504.1 thymidine kinase [Xanthomonadales bacterium]HPI95043.1 thymidine kinase [Gammaproteobacteria bacterium]